VTVTALLPKANPPIGCQMQRCGGLDVKHAALYLLAGAAGGFVLSELMPAEAALAGGLAIPEAPELLPEGVLVSAGGVDGIAGGGEVEGVVAGGLMGAGVTVSSTFLPQAPSTSSAESATAVAAGLNWTEFMGVSF
jgi:hypothetical protein